MALTPEQERKTMYDTWFKTPRLFQDLLGTADIPGTLKLQFPQGISSQSLADMAQRITRLRQPANDTQRGVVANMFTVGSFNAAYSTAPGTPPVALPPPDWF